MTGPDSPAGLAVGALAAFILGFSKTGVPGSGILVVPLMAAVWGGWLSVGATLPLLILADLFAVAHYRSHARADHLRRLAPWVLGGMAAGTVALAVFGAVAKDVLTPVIGWIVLGMLGLAVLRGRWGERLTPTSPVGVAATGFLGGFTTLVSNAAGPIMQIYLLATKMPRENLMGTTAVYFFLFNVAKIPLLLGLTLRDPAHPLFTPATLLFDLKMVPAVVAGAVLGRWALPRIPVAAFNAAIWVLTLVAAVRLILG